MKRNPETHRKVTLRTESTAMKDGINDHWAHEESDVVVSVADDWVTVIKNRWDHIYPYSDAPGVEHEWYDGARLMKAGAWFRYHAFLQKKLADQTSHLIVTVIVNVPEDK